MGEHMLRLHPFPCILPTRLKVAIKEQVKYQHITLQAHFVASLF
jgi:hypothetical protein